MNLLHEESAPSNQHIRCGPYSVLQCPYPTQADQTLVTIESSTLSDLIESQCTELFLFTPLIGEDNGVLYLIPLKGLTTEWQPIIAPVVDCIETFPGYITTQGAPKLATENLEAIQTQITAISGLKEPYNMYFAGPPSDANLFARLVRGEVEQWRIWEDDKHVAFLTPFPNTAGFTVLVPRAHLPSNVFEVPEEDFVSLMKATLTVMRILKKAFGVDRVGVAFEGLEIDYTHVKLIPVPGGPKRPGEPPESQFFETYPGFLTTQRGPLVPQEQLESLHSTLRAIVASINATTPKK